MPVFWDATSSGLICGVVLVVTFSLAAFLRGRCQAVGLCGRFVLVTGCDSGFGQQIARRLDQRGCHVIATCLTRQGADELRSATSDRASVFRMDVTDSDQIQQTCAEVRQKLVDARAGKGEGEGRDGCALSYHRRKTSHLLPETRLV